MKNMYLKTARITSLCSFLLTLNSCGRNDAKAMMRNKNQETKPEILSDTESIDLQPEKIKKDEDSKENVNQEIENDLDVYISQLGKASAETVKYTSISNAVLFIGPSGCGIGTTINYLFGYRMIESNIKFSSYEWDSSDDEYEYTQSKKVIDVDMTNLDPRNVARISHAIIGNILCPESYSSKDFTYFDIQGFCDNRSDINQFATTIANNMLIRSVKNIKALVITTIFNNLSDNRGVVFIRGCIDIIQNTFKKYKVTDGGTKKVNDDGNEKEEIDPMKSVYFLFTKCPDKVSRSLIKNKIIRLKNNYVMDIDEAPIRYKEFIFFLDKILENSGNILYVKPLDGGKTKEKILKSIRKSPGLVTDSFNFLGGDQTYRKLEVFCTMAIMKAKGPLRIIKNYNNNIEQRLENLIKIISPVRVAPNVNYDINEALRIEEKLEEAIKLIKPLKNEISQILESHKKILKARPLLNLVKNIDKSIPLSHIKGLGDLYKDLEDYDKMKEEKSNENQKEEKKSDQ